jgi:hypothetical protein
MEERCGAATPSRGRVLLFCRSTQRLQPFAGDRGEVEFGG